jgi:hypothetical protein
MGVDITLRLIAIPGLPERERDFHRVRLLEVAGRSILPELARWQRSSPKEW